MVTLDTKTCQGFHSATGKVSFVISISFESLLVPALLTDYATILTIAKGYLPHLAVLTLHTSQPKHLPKAIGTVPPLQMVSTAVVM